MKIVHVCLGCFYIDNYSYQENLLPKYHQILGYDVEIIASLFNFDVDGKPTYLKEARKYKNEYGISVTRLLFKKNVFKNINKKLKYFEGLDAELEQSNPDIIFIHGCQFMDIKKIVKYVKKNTNVTIYVDNHADFSNSAKNWFSKNILHKILWKRAAWSIEPFTEKFYGVLPARVDFLKKIYKLPENKIELLVMGADDDEIIKVKQKNFKEVIRKKLNIKNDEFLIITGGKIDQFKQQTLLLMEAVNNIENGKVKLVVFGSVIEEFKDRVDELCSEKVQYIGWINAADSYKYFDAADLAVFPGRHSVFWEQVVGQGIPLLVKYWKGTTHIDLGGNVEFLYEDSIQEIQKKITEITTDKDKYEKMRSLAISDSAKLFSYKEIAKRSINHE